MALYGRDKVLVPQMENLTCSIYQALKYLQIRQAAPHPFQIHDMQHPTVHKPIVWWVSNPNYKNQWSPWWASDCWMQQQGLETELTVTSPSWRSRVTVRPGYSRVPRWSVLAAKNTWESPPRVSRRNMLWKKVLFCEEINIENYLVNSSLPWTFSFFHLSFTHKHMYTGAKEKTLKCFMLKTHCKPYYFFFKHNHTLVNDLLQGMEMHCSEEAQQSM
jgi:hypothetical protein